ncbi:hypothetical protein AB0M13_15430, partial [Nocardia fluminea]|uniref:hypothetical protein n=1 Tax=Nocardia fluminea TaxID=134984 RepID=UPI003444BA69
AGEVIARRTAVFDPVSPTQRHLIDGTATNPPLRGGSLLGVGMCGVEFWSAATRAAHRAGSS